MMTVSEPLKIALTGSHGTGKTWIADELTKLLSSEGLKVGRIDSPTRYIKSLGYQNNEGSGFQMQLLSGTQRVVRQREVLKSGVDVVIGDRCLLDELAYNAYLSTIKDEREVELLEYTTTLLTEFYRDDAVEYWDQVFYKPLHPDFPPEDDGDRPVDLEFWKFIDRQIEEDWEYLTPERKQKKLHIDRRTAFSEISDYISSSLALNLI